mgnify:CR=1 FL=1
MTQQPSPSDDTRALIRHHADRFRHELESTKTVPTIDRLIERSPVTIYKTALTATIEKALTASDLTARTIRLIRAKVRALGRTLAGLFLPQNDRTGREGVIVIDGERRDQLLRWTVSHELGHAILKHSGTAYFDGSWRSLDGLAREASTDIAIQEVEANLFASYLVFPDGAWHSLVTQDRFNETTLRRVARGFDVSHMSAAMELVQRAHRPSAAIVIQRGMPEFLGSTSKELHASGVHTSQKLR